MNAKNTLLPSGFADILPPNAAQESRTVAILMKSLAAFGYEQVKPPIMEFESTLLGNASENVSQQSFRVMDPASREMMAIRADMTTQVSRIATTRLKDEPRPLRISYAGQVLRVKGEGLYAERQLAQAGAELIGKDTAEADAETIFVAIDAINNLGITDISVDLSLPTLPKILGAKSDLLDAIARKDIAAIKKSAGDNAALFEALANISDISGIESLDAKNLSKEAKELVARIKAIYSIINTALPELKITIDPLEHRGFEYYTGFSFAIFSSNQGDELGRGGRYIMGQKKETACGFALSVNAILRCLPAKNDREKIFVPTDTPFETVKGLQSSGMITICSVDVSDAKAEAKRLACDFVWLDNQKEPVK